MLRTTSTSQLFVCGETYRKGGCHVRLSKIFPQSRIPTLISEIDTIWFVGKAYVN